MILAIVLLTAIINLLLGIISYNKNPSSVTNRLLTALTVIFAFWTIANYFSLHSSTEQETLFWIRTVMFITAPLGPVLYLFIRTFPHSKLKVSKPLLFTLIILTLVVQALAFTPFLFSEVTLGEQITPKPGPGIILFAFLFVIVPLVGLFELIRKYKRTADLEKLQLRYLLLGIGLTFFLGILTNFLLVVFFNISQFVILGPIFSLIFVGCILYAIIKHRLLQIRLILALSAAYTIMITVLAAIYTLSIFLISTYIFHLSVSSVQLTISIMLVIFVVLTFERLKRMIENITNTLFFRSKYNSAELILDLTTLTASTYSLKVLTRTTLDKLLKTLYIEHGVFLINKVHGKFLTVPMGYKKNQEYPQDVLKELVMIKEMAILDEEKDIQKRHMMHKLHAFITLPLIEQNHTVGFLLLGNKKSGEVYTAQDIKILEIFAPLITVAIQNAKSYDEIKRFNKTLNEKVLNATKELQMSHEKLKTLDQQKDAFLGMASHELKTPITSIKAFTQVLLKKAEQDKESKYEYILKNINMQTDRITQLINDLLNVSHIESGKLVLKKSEFNISKLVKKAVTDIQVTTDTHEIIVKGNVTKTMYADKNRIEQVIANLLTNAIKYSPQANKVIVSLHETAKEISVLVQDFGQGIALEDQKRIFERFYRTRENEEKNITGFGLGLYISSEIIRHHKGRIWVSSTVGKGSLFGFSIPYTKRTE